MELMELYVVEVVDDGESFQYEYGDLPHAEEHFQMEKAATIYGYRDGKHYFIKAKM